MRVRALSPTAEDKRFHGRDPGTALPQLATRPSRRPLDGADGQLYPLRRPVDHQVHGHEKNSPKAAPPPAPRKHRSIPVAAGRRLGSRPVARVKGGRLPVVLELVPVDTTDGGGVVDADDEDEVVVAAAPGMLGTA